MQEPLRVSEVFVPGRLPAHTYNPRAELRLEERLRDYLEEAGAVLTVAGPTKTGKTVLLKNIVQTPIWIEGQGIESVEVLWERLGDALSVYAGRSVTYGQTDSTSYTFRGQAGFAPVATVGGETEAQNVSELNRTFSVERPLSSVVREFLAGTRRPIIIDDFHFIARVAQREVVRALKPFVLDGVPIIFISISHRVQDVISAEPDMTGRVESLEVEFWSEADLQVIARKGFHVLGIVDQGEQVGQMLSANSYGSPHLMQKFCREICKSQGIRESRNPPISIPADINWDEFFAAQIDTASGNWFERLQSGPKPKGNQRTIWALKDGRSLDGYGLTLQAIADTGPLLQLSKDAIVAGVKDLVSEDGPASNQTTRVLQHMSKIAGKRATEPLLDEDELDAVQEDPQSVPDVQPVLEYIDMPMPVLHIVDPFFAFYLKWGSASHLGGERATVTERSEQGVGTDQ